MELICEKYGRKMPADRAECRHGGEYCKFRTACMIHFMQKQTKEEAADVRLRFDKGNGLLPAIVQDHASGEVLMVAYINEEAWLQTLSTGKAHYWSRSRNKLWLKGETSGHLQVIKEIRVDCDEDTVVFLVEQLGGAACHKGYRSCFFRRVVSGGLEEISKPVFDPGEVYKK